MNHTQTQTLKKQDGVSLAMLLFAIIIISLLAAALMRLNEESAVSNAQHVIAARAFFAAESGAQIEAMVIFPVNGGASACNSTSHNYNFSVNGLSSCSANVVCEDVTIGSATYYRVVSVGTCNAGQPFESNRTIEIRLKAVN